MSDPGRHLVFLHGAPESGGAEWSRDTLVVALTPTAFDWASSRGLEVTVPDDHVDRQTLVPPGHEYHRWQVDWFRRLDDAVEAGGAIRTAAHLLKTPVDSLVVWSRILDGIFQAYEPSAARYVGAAGLAPIPWHNGNLQFRPLLGDRPLAADIVPLVAQHRRTPSSTIGVPQLRAATTEVPSWSRQVRSRTARLLGPWRQIRNAHGAVRKHGVFLMLWYADYGASGFVARQAHLGCRPYFLIRDRPYTYVTEIIRPWHRSPRANATPELPAPSASAAAALLDELDSWTGVNGAGRLLESRVTTMANGLVPVINAIAATLRPFLEHVAPREVAAANPSSLEEFGALLATEGLPRRQRTLVQHGDHMFPYDFWLVTETQNFDHMICSDPSVPDDIEEDAVALGVPAPTFSYDSPRVEGFTRRRAQPAGQSIVYLPTPLIGDSYVVSVGYFEDAWYHRWHHMLLGAMARRPGLRFIWKALPRADQSLDPIPRMIRDLSIDNVVYRTEPFLRVLPEASRVFTDFPGTGLYQTVHAGIPVLALSFPRFARLRPRAVALFARVLRSCRTEQEALRHLDEFLDSPAERWILPPSVLEHA